MLFASSRFIAIDCRYKNVDIKSSAHDAPLEQPSSGTIEAKIFERQII